MRLRPSIVVGGLTSKMGLPARLSENGRRLLSARL